MEKEKAGQRGVNPQKGRQKKRPVIFFEPKKKAAWWDLSQCLRGSTVGEGKWEQIGTEKKKKGSKLPVRKT